MPWCSTVVDWRERALDTGRAKGNEGVNLNGKRYTHNGHGNEFEHDDRGSGNGRMYGIPGVLYSRNRIGIST